MRRYSDPVEVRSGPRSGAVQGPAPERDGVPVDDAMAPAPGPEAVDGTAARAPEAFLWQGRLYVVRRILAHWRERRPWWRDALDPAPGQATGIDVASREQQVWRVEASRGRSFATGVFDLTNNGAEGAAADWRLVRVAD
jgi:Family of unknown function (DUF6504)